MGYCVRGGVDLNDDAQLDWLACAPGDVNRETALANEDRGEVFVFSGDLSGKVDAREGAIIHLTGHEPGLHFGTTAALSDLGGPMLAVGARDESMVADGAGAVYLFTSPLEAEMSSSDADAVIRHNREGERFGTQIELVDLNGDGVVDVISGGRGGSALEDEERGTVAWFTGPLLGAYLIDDAEGRVIGAPEALVGHAFSAGDMNGDGYEELLLGNMLDSTNGDSAGAAFIFQGGAAELSASLAYTQAKAGIYGEAGEQLGLVTIGDVDANGLEDTVLASVNGTGASLFYGPVSYTHLTLPTTPYV